MPLLVDEISERCDGAKSPMSNEPLPCGGMPARLMIVSDAFLTALTEQERGTFQARPLEWTSGSGRRFFELIPRSFVEAGAVKGGEVNGWRCERCGRRVFSYGYGIQTICRQHLPPDSPTFFFVGCGTDVNLYCTRGRWRSLAGQAWARKLTGNPLAVLDASDFESEPLLGTLADIDEFHRQHGFAVPFKPKRQA
jgi:hypothetical protein